MGRPLALKAVRRRYWELVGEGVAPWTAAARLGVSDTTGGRWFRHAGGVKPQFSDAGGTTWQRLSAAEREEISIGRARGESMRCIADRLRRSPSTISREIDTNGDGRSGYRAHRAQQRSEDRARRPKAGKLSGNPELWGLVDKLLDKKYSPEQIAGVLAKTYPDRPEMQVSHETIYKAIYVQGRGELRRELHRCLRTGRAVRKPRRRSGSPRGRIPGMVNISERPAEAEDRAVPGHWEGDLIIGKDQASQIGTLVERSSGLVQLLHLQNGRTADVVAEAMITKIKQLPDTLRRTLTWDQGHELAAHHKIGIDAGIEIFFCDPHSPWQRGSNENTNGLLRQYFPKGTDLSKHSAEYLDEVAAELNNRPRKRYNFDSPAQVIDRLLSESQSTTVAINP
jgi:IS30 family transposase